MTQAGLTASPAAPAAGRAGFRRLMITMGAAAGGLSAVYAGVGTVLLPQQIEDIDRPHKVAALGVVAGVSAVFALVFNPVAARCRTGPGPGSAAAPRGCWSRPPGCWSCWHSSARRAQSCWC